MGLSAPDNLLALVENAPLGVYLVDSALRVCAANQLARFTLRQFEPLLGRDFEEMSRIRWPDELATSIVGRFRHTLATGEPYLESTFNERRRDVDEVSAFEWRIERVALPDGSWAVACYFHDLTPLQRSVSDLNRADEARRDSEERLRTSTIALQASESRYSTLFAALEEGVLVLERQSDGEHTDYGYLAANPVATELFGIGEGGMKTIRQSFPEGSDAWLTLFEQTLSTGEPTRLESKMTSTGRIFDVFCSRVGSAPLGQVLVVIQEVTDRVQAERERSDEQEMRGFLLDFSDTLRSLNDPKEMLSVAVRLLEEKLGAVRVSAGESVGNEVLLEEDELTGLSVLRVAVFSVQALEPREWKPSELALCREVADRTWAAAEQARAEAELRASEQKLLDEDRRKDEFLALLAHELRNPLAPIRTGLQMIGAAGDTAEAVQRVRLMMERQVEHMVRLIEDLLDVSRISSGKIRLQRETSVLAGLVDTAVDANRAALNEKRLTLEVSLPADPVYLDVDPTRLVQVVSNLLHNAVKFTPAGGRISVTAQVHDAGPELELVVSDTGEGITPQVLPHVFDMFSQGQSKTEGAQAGLGLGLSLARRLTEMHGGTLSAASAGPGQGSSFTLRLPTLLRIPSHAPLRVSPALGPGPTTRRVLVIDDNQDSADVMADLLIALGGQAAAAYDGEEGIELARTFGPEVVFLDIGMPGMDGYETCRRLRHEYGAQLVVVAMTGWGQESDKLQALQAGFDAHLTKPVDPSKLRRILDGLAPG